MTDIATIDSHAVDASTTRVVASLPAARASWITRLVLLVLFLLNIAAFAGGYWLWLQLQHAAEKHDSAVQQLTQQNQQLAVLKKQLDDKATSDNIFRQQTINTLKDNSEKLRGLDRIDTSYWRLAEAEFLLKQAHQRLFITHDAETADLLLASADSAIMQQKDPALLPVRSAIALDRAALRKVPRVDRDGIYLRLQALSSQAGMLTSDNRFLRVGEEDNTTDVALSYSEKMWRRLLSIVRIRHHDQPVEPLLPPEQEVYLRQNLQLVLVQSQLGLLQSQQQTYASNLDRAVAWVNQYCDTEDSFVKSWLDEAGTLMRIDIAPDLPDISGSLRTVQKLIDQRAQDIQQALMMGDDEDPDTTDDSSPVEKPAAAGAEK
ncbi:MAG TPA: uroporphyrinogen-III C-methyltransferase [Pseudomonadales bacterium]|nr:uroporphyrinogen-III C-methyltransferase [Pseudomonadales bacterium]